MQKRSLIISIGLITAAILSSAANATITVSPKDPYEFGTDNAVPFAAINATSTTLSGGAIVDTLNDFQLLDHQDDSSTDSDRSSMVMFDVRSDKVKSQLGADEDNDELVVIVEARSATDSTKFVPIRIAAASTIDAFDDDDIPSTCVDSSNCQGSGDDLSGTPSGLFAARYTEGTILRIGIYPKELCESFDAQSADDAEGCSASTPEATFPFTQIIRITVTFAEDGDKLGESDNSSADVSSSITLNYQNDPPTFTCTTLTDSYFPGDEEIFVDTGIFGISDSSNGANADTVLVIANQDAFVAGDYESSYLAADIVARRIEDLDAAKVKGFTNGEDYNVCFTAVDDAGVIFTNNGTVCDGVPATGCALSGVQTADIEGFLKESNCFIASASFRSQTASGVQLLRTFRDRILLKFGLGRGLVDLYYAASPPAARWLLERPMMRIPVLGILLPLQGLAWFALHPGLMILMAMIGGVSLMIVTSRRRRGGA